MSQYHLQKALNSVAALFHVPTELVETHEKHSKIVKEAKKEMNNIKLQSSLLVFALHGKHNEERKLLKEKQAEELQVLKEGNLQRIDAARKAVLGAKENRTAAMAEVRHNLALTKLRELNAQQRAMTPA